MAREEIVIPSLNVDPKYIEGPSGGPAQPTGPTLSSEDKEEMSDMAETTKIAAGGVVLIGLAVTATGIGSGAAPGAAVLAGSLAVASSIFTALANDPPKPYENIVQFGRLKSSFPKPKNNLSEKLYIAAQNTMFTGITGQGLLDAAERREGAIIAKDIDWAIMHDSVVKVARTTLALNAATTAAALKSVAVKIRGTDLDVETSSVDIKNIMLLFIETETEEVLKANGVTATSANEAFELVRVSSSNVGSGLVSEILSKQATLMHGIAVRSLA